jgi:hypothetical protein
LFLTYFCGFVGVLAGVTKILIQELEIRFSIDGVMDVFGIMYS